MNISYSSRISLKKILPIFTCNYRLLHGEISKIISITKISISLLINLVVEFFVSVSLSQYRKYIERIFDKNFLTVDNSYFSLKTN